MNTDLIPVCVGACLCPAAPHADGDFVYLRPKLGLRPGIELQTIITDARQPGSKATSAEVTGLLVEAYLLVGVAEWNLEDEAGLIPVTRQAIADHLLSDFTRATPAADKADELYYAPVIGPLVTRVQASVESSSGTSSNGSTSPTRNGSPKRPKRSKPSSTSTTRTAVTATT